MPFGKPMLTNIHVKGNGYLSLSTHYPGGHTLPYFSQLLLMKLRNIIYFDLHLFTCSLQGWLGLCDSSLGSTKHLYWAGGDTSGRGRKHYSKVIMLKRFYLIGLFT